MRYTRVESTEHFVSRTTLRNKQRPAILQLHLLISRFKRPVACKRTITHHPPSLSLYLSISISLYLSPTLYISLYLYLSLYLFLSSELVSDPKIIFTWCCIWNTWRPRNFTDSHVKYTVYLGNRFRRCVLDWGVISLKICGKAFYEYIR